MAGYNQSNYGCCRVHLTVLKRLGMAEAEPQQLPTRRRTERSRRLPHIERRRCDLRLTLAAQPATMLHTEPGLQSAPASGPRHLTCRTSPGRQGRRVAACCIRPIAPR